MSFELPKTPEPTQGLGVHRWAYGKDDLEAYAKAHEAGVVAMYEEVLTGYRRLVRELDVLLNGEFAAAPQASLVDLVVQVRHTKHLEQIPEVSRMLRCFHGISPINHCIYCDAP